PPPPDPERAADAPAGRARGRDRRPPALRHRARRAGRGDRARVGQEPGERRHRPGHAGRARVEQGKRFQVRGAPWTPESGELTPTLKLRRRIITERYASEIDDLY